MFKFIWKTSRHFGSSTRTSQTHNSYFFQIQPFSSSLKPTKNSPSQNSFTVTYLINSCGFPPEKALTASKNLTFGTPNKPDSVLAFFKNHGFTQTQISNIIRNRPPLLMCDPEKTLLPKLQFFESKGVSNTDVTRIVCSSPVLLQRSLEKVVIPAFNFFSNLFQSEEKTITAIKRCASLLLFNQQPHVIPNIEILREAGVPNANIMYLLTKQPRAFMTSSDQFRQIVKDVEMTGFDPLSMNFVSAVHALRAMTKSTWEKKVDVYKKWGWTEEEILVAFKKHPWCMAASEDKINGVMNFLVNKIGLETSSVARRSIVISLSLEKRIVPRCAVYQALLSKGLINTNGFSLMTMLRTSEKLFLEKFVNRHKEEATELLNLYKKKLDLSSN